MNARSIAAVHQRVIPCPKRGGEMWIIAFVTDTSAVRAILAHVSNPAGCAKVRFSPILLKNSKMHLPQFLASLDRDRQFAL